MWSGRAEEMPSLYVVYYSHSVARCLDAIGLTRAGACLGNHVDGCQTTVSMARFDTVVRGGLAKKHDLYCRRSRKVENIDAPYFSYKVFDCVPRER
jgi:hypothetical protein